MKITFHINDEQTDLIVPTITKVQQTKDKDVSIRVKSLELMENEGQEGQTDREVSGEMELEDLPEQDGAHSIKQRG